MVIMTFVTNNLAMLLRHFHIVTRSCCFHHAGESIGSSIVVESVQWTLDYVLIEQGFVLCTVLFSLDTVVSFGGNSICFFLHPPYLFFKTIQCSIKLSFFGLAVSEV